MICPGGAEVVRRMASRNFRGSYDQAEIETQGGHSLSRTKDEQTQTPHAFRARFCENSGAARYKA